MKKISRKIWARRTMWRENLDRFSSFYLQRELSAFTDINIPYIFFYFPFFAGISICRAQHRNSNSFSLLLSFVFVIKPIQDPPPSNMFFSPCIRVNVLLNCASVRVRSKHLSSLSLLAWYFPLSLSFFFFQVHFIGLFVCLFVRCERWKFLFFFLLILWPLKHQLCMMINISSFAHLDTRVLKTKVKYLTVFFLMFILSTSNLLIWNSDNWEAFLVVKIVSKSNNETKEMRIQSTVLCKRKIFVSNEVK